MIKISNEFPISQTWERQTCTLSIRTEEDFWTEIETYSKEKKKSPVDTKTYHG